MPEWTWRNLKVAATNIVDMLIWNQSINQHFFNPCKKRGGGHESGEWEDQSFWDDKKQIIEENQVDEMTEILKKTFLKVEGGGKVE